MRLLGHRERDRSRSGRQPGPGVPPPVCWASGKLSSRSDRTQHIGCGLRSSGLAHRTGTRASRSPQPRAQGCWQLPQGQPAGSGPAVQWVGGTPGGDIWEPGPPLPLPHPCKPGPGWEGRGPQMRPSAAQPRHTPVHAHTLTPRHRQAQRHTRVQVHARTCTDTHTYALLQICATSCSPASQAQVKREPVTWRTGWSPGGQAGHPADRLTVCMRGALCSEGPRWGLPPSCTLGQGAHVVRVHVAPAVMLLTLRLRGEHRELSPPSSQVGLGCTVFPRSPGPGAGRPPARPPGRSLLSSAAGIRVPSVSFSHVHMTLGLHVCYVEPLHDLLVHRRNGRPQLHHGTVRLDTRTARSGRACRHVATHKALLGIRRHDVLVSTCLHLKGRPTCEFLSDADSET